MSTQLDPLTLSADLLYEVKTGGETDELRELLASFDRERFARALSSRSRRLSFWLNGYNAFAQLLLEDDPSLLEGGRIDRWRFFARVCFPIAGVHVSLDDVQHGMLRGSKHPWGFGYLPRPFPSSFERDCCVEGGDPRIHFALSYGAETCPPVAVYTPDDAANELDVATEWYLEENVSYDPQRDVATVPRLFRWYRGDFGGSAGVREFLGRYGAMPTDGSPTLEYDDFDRSIEVQGIHR